MHQKNTGALIQTLTNADTLVVLLPHCDDEVFCIEYIRVHRAQRKIICFLTAGPLAKVRLRESKNFFARMEIPSLEFNDLGSQLSIPDGHLSRHLDGVQAVLIALELQNTELLVPAAEGGHQDHDAASLLAHRLKLIPSSPFTKISWFFTYNGLNTRGPFFLMGRPNDKSQSFPRKSDLQNEIQKLYLIFRCYRSQLKTWLVLVPVYFLSLLVGRSFGVIDARAQPMWINTKPLFFRHGRVNEQGLKEFKEQWL